MKRFRFRLQRVLDVRVQIRDEARQELVRCNAERDHQIYVLAQLQDEFLRLGLVEGGTYSASDLTRLGAYAERLTVAIDKQKVVVAHAIEAADAAQERYIEASKEAKTMEMLKDKKLQEFNAEQLREEGVLLDELAVQRATRGIH
jgi:flagellar FliJ protein